jgi:hypothetical protein
MDLRQPRPPKAKRHTEQYFSPLTICAATLLRDVLVQHLLPPATGAISSGAVRSPLGVGMTS